MAHKKLLDPIHPGEILLEEFMKPLGISINRLARDKAHVGRLVRREMERIAIFKVLDGLPSAVYSQNVLF